MPRSLMLSRSRCCLENAVCEVPFCRIFEFSAFEKPKKYKFASTTLTDFLSEREGRSDESRDNAREREREKEIPGNLELLVVELFLFSGTSMRTETARYRTF